MKLSNKFTLWYLLITAVVLVLGSGIMFFQVRHQIDKAQHARQERIHNSIAKRLVRDGGLYVPVANDQGATVSALAAAPADRAPKAEYVKEWCSEQNHEVCKLAMHTTAEVDGKWFAIDTRNSIVPSADILTSVASGFVWIALLLMVVMYLFIRRVAARILAPFDRTLAAMEGFDLKRAEPVRLEGTGIVEFDRLNRFVERFTDKAVNDYRSLKEFGENTSHELQTPLAVIRAKLEMLMATDLRADQAASIADMHRAVEKLARINRSLVLLAQLENREFTPDGSLCLSTATTESLRAFAELVEMKGLHLRADVAADVHVALHASLADVLLSNLISNAIRHNIDEGGIAVRLDQRTLVVSNNGLPPPVPTEQLFGRFKKANPNCMSAGLGLAIVKQICDLHHFGLDYTYAGGLHVVSVRFNAVQPSPGPRSKEKTTPAVRPEKQVAVATA